MIEVVQKITVWPYLAYDVSVDGEVVARFYSGKDNNEKEQAEAYAEQLRGRSNQ